MQQTDYAHREIHGVVPQLDFVNFRDCCGNIEETPVKYSKIATSPVVKKQKMNGKKFVNGIFGAFDAALNLAGGDFSTGITELFTSAAEFGSGANLFNNDDLQVNDIIRECEKAAWKYACFLREFTPAECGRGVRVFKDGSCDDMHCGNGHVCFDNGDYFEGKFVNGVISNGLYIFANGVRYLGAFDGNRNLTGVGTLIYPEGACYYGELLNGNRHGTGSMWYTNGFYFGKYENNVRHGTGVFKDLNGNCSDGKWMNDGFLG